MGRAAIVRIWLAAAATAAVAMTAGLIGCASYSNYPALKGDTAVNDPNAPPLPDLMVKAVRHTVERHPVAGPYAVNLPADLKPQKAEWIVAQLDEDARLLTEETADLPTFHVSRIWVRGVKAEVDVHRPLVDVPSPRGGAAQQMVTVKLDSGLSGWRAASSKAWAVGAFEPPAPRYETAQVETEG